MGPVLHRAPGLQGRAPHPQRPCPAVLLRAVALALLAAALAGCTVLQPARTARAPLAAENPLPVAVPVPAPGAAPAPVLAHTAAEQSAALPGAFALRVLPGSQGAHVPALQRAERAAPARYRVLVLPGSGCAGMAPVASRYFAGLLHAQVLVLHKPWVDPAARTPPGQCSAAFVQADALGAWRDHALAALRADAQAQAALQARTGRAPLPQVLVGISEGAELLAALAPQVPHLALVVLIGASGLDPREAGALQAQRLGLWQRWQAIGTAVHGDGLDTWPDSRVLEGRSLRYWRDLWHWPLAAPLQAAPWPLWLVQGADDALVPPAAYARFAAQMQVQAQAQAQVQTQDRSAPRCLRTLPGADHGLQSAQADGVQQVWAALEQWARTPQAGACSALHGG